MTAKELLDAGKVREAEMLLTAHLRNNPADSAQRTFLFELLCFSGQYARAEKQLGVLSQGSKEAEMGAVLYYSALHGEKTRHEMFQKQEYPTTPAPPSPPGTLNGKPFQSITDADPAIGARLEMYAAGAYLWIPFEHIASVEMPAPHGLRDTLWAPAFVLTGPGFKGTDIGQVILPAIYPFSWKSDDGSVVMGRSTEWVRDEEGHEFPVGQKTFIVDGEEVPLLEIRSLEFLPMPLREDILNPIPGDNPSGESLRYAPVYDKIKELRREDDELNQGAWQHERKVANHPEVIKLTQEVIATQSKDLQLAAWLCESLLKKEGIRGLFEGLQLCRELVTRFWDTVYPAAEDGDLEERAAPIEWIGTKLVIAARGVPLCRDGFNLFQYQESRTVLTEEAAQSKEQKAARDKALKEGKLAPEIFDRSFGETPKAFYADLEKQIDGSVAEVKALDEVCSEKFADSSPSLGQLRDGLGQVRTVVHALLQKKRETDPDPVEEIPPEQTEAGAEGAEGAEGEASEGGSAWGASFAGRASTESADRREAIANVVAAAALLRKKDPFSPAAYLMLRGLRWGELRGSSDPGILEAPPSDLRQQIKALAMRGKWTDLIELAEHVMTLPCSRAWLDLQRFVVEACTALGDDYNSIAIAIRSELRTLLRDLPKLMTATLSDDTAAANADTQKWLAELVAEPSNGTPLPGAPSTPVVDDARAPGWQKKFVDPHALALEAIRTGQPQKAVEILQREVERQRSGRGQFQRKLQLAQICIAAGKDAIAQPLLDDILAKLDAHKLEEWEDPETVAAALTLLVQASKKVQADAKVKQAMFERICRLDPVRAFSV